MRDIVLVVEGKMKHFALSLAALAMAGAVTITAAQAQEIDRAHTLVWGVAATPAGLDGGFYYSLEALEVE